MPLAYSRWSGVIKNLTHKKIVFRIRCRFQFLCSLSLTYIILYFLFIFCLPIKRKVVIHSAREICDKAEGSLLPEAASSNLPLCSSYLVSHSSPSIPTRLPLDARTNLKILFTPPFICLVYTHTHTHNTSVWLFDLFYSFAACLN